MNSRSATILLRLGTIITCLIIMGSAVPSSAGEGAPPPAKLVRLGQGARITHSPRGILFEICPPSSALSSSPSSGSLHERSSPFTCCRFTASFVGACRVEPRPERLLDSHASAAANAVFYRGLYPGIDLHTFTRPSRMKYEFRLAPGADWRQIAVHYDGIDRLSTDAAGTLHVHVALGELIDAAPFVYQIIAGRQVSVPARFRLLGPATYGFEIMGEVDPTKELVIDPDIQWGMFGKVFGEIAIDPQGNIIVANQVSSSCSCETLDAFDPTYNGGYSDAYLAKYSPRGELLWGTYLGGNDSDTPRDLIVDSSGATILVGTTSSLDFPTTDLVGTKGSADVFIAKMDATGQLEWSLILAGVSSEGSHDATVDRSGNILVAGSTQSRDFPGITPTSSGAFRADLIAKISPQGKLLWVRTLDWSSTGAIATDASGNVFAVSEGRTISKFGPGGKFAWQKSIDYGFPLDKMTDAICDSTGNIIVGGNTDYDEPPGRQAFAAKVNPNAELVWAKILGPSGSGQVRIALDPADGVVASGVTSSKDFPVPNGFDTKLGAIDNDIFIANLSRSGELLWASFLGGEQGEYATGLAADARGGIYLAGGAATDVHGGLLLPTNQGFIAGNGPFIASLGPGYRLSVQSVPAGGVAITGDIPGVADYSVICDEQQIVNLAAPPTATVDGEERAFVAWLVNGERQPAGQTSVQVPMTTGRTAVAAYAGFQPELTVVSYSISNVTMAGDKPGTTPYKVSCDDGQPVTLEAPAKIISGSYVYTFTGWIVDGVSQPEADHTARVAMDRPHTVRANYKGARTSLYVRSTPITGIQIGSSYTNYTYKGDYQPVIGLVAPASHTVEDKTYGFVRWILNEAAQPEGQVLLSVAMEGQRVAVAEYRDRAAKLVTVRSEPLPGVPITGGAEGTTDYEVYITGPITFKAPTTATSAPPEYRSYRFKHWVIDGVAQPADQAAVTVNADAPHSLVAVYAPFDITISVESLPISGISITGDFPGTTDYTFATKSDQTITLQAPETVSVAGEEYVFRYWRIDYHAQPEGQATLSVPASWGGPLIAVYRNKFPAITVKAYSNSGGDFPGITFTGSKPGTTPYTAACQPQEVVTLHAPVTFSTTKTDYIFLGWKFSGKAELLEPSGIRFAFEQDVTVTAEYRPRPVKLSVQSVPFDGVTISGGLSGVTNYSSWSNRNYGYKLTAPAQMDRGATQHSFLRWVIDDAKQTDLAHTLNVLMSGDRTAVAVYTLPGAIVVSSSPPQGIAIIGDSPGITPYSIPSAGLTTVSLEAPISVTSSDTGYRFVHWLVDGIAQPEGQATVEANNTHHAVTAIYAEVNPVLTVTSTGTTAVPITGDKPSTTDYTVTCQTGEVVTLEAPASVPSGDWEYTFVRWCFNENAELLEPRKIRITMNGSTTVNVEYEYHQPTLTVQSEPFTGVKIDGYSGTTNYTVDRPRNETVHQKAPLTADHDGLHYVLSHWLLDGVEQALLEREVSVKMDNDHTITAVYRTGALLTVSTSTKSPAPITGDTPGETPYSAAFFDPEPASLAAPTTMVWNNVTYGFLRWTVDDEPQDESQPNLQLYMDVNHAAVAVYQAHTDLTVMSSPPGIKITGDKPGITPYTADCYGAAKVSLQAPTQRTIDGIRYTFSHWTVFEEGHQQQFSQALLALQPTGRDTTAEAVYASSIRTLAVTSTPITGIAIAGSRPGTTDYTASCQLGDVLTLTAPATFVPEGTTFHFSHWILNGRRQQRGETCLSTTISDDTTATAAYTTSSVIIKGPGERGEGILPYGGGTLTVDVFLAGFPAINYLETAVQFTDLAGNPASFPVQTTDASSAFGNLMIDFNAMDFPHATTYAMSANGPMIGFVSMADASAISETRIFTITYRYGPSDHGTHAIAADPRFTEAGTLTADLPYYSVPGSVTISIPGDLNGDCTVNILDLIALRPHIGERGPSGSLYGDLNNDGLINILDLVQIRQRLGQKCE